MVDEDRPLVSQVGQYVRVFVKEVGFVPGRTVRQSNRLIAVQFDLAQSLERDLLISKLFTVGLNTATDVGTGPSATVASSGASFRFARTTRKLKFTKCHCHPSKSLVPKAWWSSLLNKFHR